jgi:hypothetical protein
MRLLATMPLRRTAVRIIAAHWLVWHLWVAALGIALAISLTIGASCCTVGTAAAMGLLPFAIARLLRVGRTSVVTGDGVLLQTD